MACSDVIARDCLTAALPRFHARHPDIELDVRDFQQVNEAQMSGVDVMLVLVLGWPKAPDLVCRRIAAGRFIVVASLAYWAAHGIPQQPTDLERHECLTIRGVAGMVMDEWSFSRGAEQQTVRARGWLTTSNAHRDLVVELTLEGHGVMRILDWTNLPHLASGVLVQALAGWESSEAVPVNLLYGAQARRIPRARVFIDFVTELFGDLDRTRGRHVVGTERPAWLSRPHARAADFVVRPGRSR